MTASGRIQFTGIESLLINYLDRHWAPLLHMRITVKYRCELNQTFRKEVGDPMPVDISPLTHKSRHLNLCSSLTRPNQIALLTNYYFHHTVQMTWHNLICSR